MLFINDLSIHTKLGMRKITPNAGDSMEKKSGEAAPKDHLAALSVPITIPREKRADSSLANEC
jgi:hypothetical protein